VFALNAMSTPAASTSGPGPLLYRYAQLVVLAVIFLLVAGAMVTSTGSGLSVPDWPLSFGQVMPPMEGGVFYEHGHRMIATGVGVLTILLAVWLWRRDPRPWMRKLGWVALLLVVLQGVLGGLTVLLKLPVWTSAAHACLAQGFLMVVVFIALALSPGWNADRTRLTGKSHLPIWATIATLAIYLQLILGAVMRHMNAGLVIPDFPLAYGGLIPPSFTSAIAVHFAHRIGAVVVTIAVLVASTSALRSAQGGSRFSRPAIFMLVLVAVQVTLGASIIWTQRQVHVTTTHVVIGAVLLAVSLVLTVRSWRFAGPLSTASEPTREQEPIKDYRKVTA
jgi:cytochrome c oxidase assembly protein subunit 15